MSIISPANLTECVKKRTAFRAVGVFLWRCQDYFRLGPQSLAANWGGNKNKGMEVSQLYWRHLITHRYPKVGIAFGRQ